MSRSWRALSKKKLSTADGQGDKIETPAEKEFKNRSRKEKKKDRSGSKLSKLVHSLKPRTSFLSPSKDSHEKDRENRNQSPVQETESDEDKRDIQATAGASGAQQGDDDSVIYSDDQNDDYGYKAQSPSSIHNSNSINPLTVNGEIVEPQIRKVTARSMNLNEESPYARIRDMPNIKQQADSDNSDDDVNIESNQSMQRRLSFMSTRARLASPSNSGDEKDTKKVTSAETNQLSKISVNKNNLNPDPTYAVVNKSSNRMLKQLTVESNASDFTNVTSRISTDSSEENQSDEADVATEREKNKIDHASPRKRDTILSSGKSGDDVIDGKYARDVHSETSEEAYTQPNPTLRNQRLTTIIDKNTRSKYRANSVDATPTEKKKFGRKSSYSLTSSLSNFFSSALSGIHNDRNTSSNPVSRNPSQIFGEYQYDGRKRKNDNHTLSPSNRARYLKKSDSLEYNDLASDSSPRMGMRGGMESEIILSLERQIRDIESENKQLKESKVQLQKEFNNRSQSSPGGVKRDGTHSELKQDNEFLKVLVHKLNQELDRYKMKYGENENGSQELLVEKVNVGDRRLDEIKLRKKDHLLKTYSEEVIVLKEQIEDLISENKILREELITLNATTAPVSISDWNQIQEQAQLVLDENALLKERQTLSETNLQEITRKYAQQIDSLNQNIQDLKDKISEVESRPNKRNEALLQKYEKLLAKSDKKIDMDDHLRIIEEKNRSMIQTQAEYNRIITELKSDVQTEKKEKRALTLQLIETTEAAERLQKELKSSRSEIGKSQKKILILTKKLELAEEKAILTTANLSDLLKVAEKTTIERNLIATKAKKHRQHYEKAQRQIQEGHLEINKLEEKLRRYEITTCQKLDSAANKLAHQDMMHDEKFMEYEYEINRLQEIVKDKDIQLDSLLGQKWKVEQQLDNLWYAAANGVDDI